MAAAGGTTLETKSTLRILWMSRSYRSLHALIGYQRSMSVTERRQSARIIPVTASSVCLRSLLQALLSPLPLRSVASVRNTCRQAGAFLGDDAPFWRTKAIEMHGDWLWELKDRNIFRQHTINWQTLLRQIEIARSEILDNAGQLTTADRKAGRETGHGYIYRTKPFGNKRCSKLPLGLKNRLRIWCSITSIGKDGRQIALQGQKKGLDPLHVPEWDGVSNHAACPSGDHPYGIHLNSLKIIAGRTDLT